MKSLPMNVHCGLLCLIAAVLFVASRDNTPDLRVVAFEVTTAISFSRTTFKEDFAYSEVRFGIEPGETFEKSYPFSRSSPGAELPTLHLLAVLLKDGTSDGNSTVAQQIKDERLGEKIQIHRMLKVWRKQEGQVRI